MQTNSIPLRQITEAGLLIAAALALSQFKVFQMPSGGSVSFAPLPLLLLSARRGVRLGALAGGIAGLLLSAMHPFVVHPVQFVLDYPLAYSTVGLAGIIRWKTPAHALLAILGSFVVRLFLHVLAGFFYFIPAGISPINACLASLTYNLTHLGPEALACSIIGLLIVRTRPDLACVDEQPGP